VLELFKERNEGVEMGKREVAAGVAGPRIVGLVFKVLAD